MSTESPLSLLKEDPDRDPSERKKIDIANFDMRDVVNKYFTPDVSAYEGHINVLDFLDRIESAKGETYFRLELETFKKVYREFMIDQWLICIDHPTEDLSESLVIEITKGENIHYYFHEYLYVYLTFKVEKGMVDVWWYWYDVIDGRGVKDLQVSWKKSIESILGDIE